MDACVVSDDGGVGIIPEYMTIGAACFDIATPDAFEFQAFEPVKINLHLKFFIPNGWSLHIYGRSSTLLTYGFIVPTTIIDSDYDGWAHGIVVPTRGRGRILAGTRLWQGQWVQVNRIDMFKVNPVKRDKNGFGGTGK